jgi:hypothetical protein
MIWFFERQQARLRYEIRHQLDGHGFELVITHSDGRQDVEQYKDPRAIVDRARDLQNTLTARGWAPPATGERSRRLAVSS